MLFELLFLAGTSENTPTTVQAGSVAVALTTAGACVIPDPTKPHIADADPEAELTITWEEENPDSELYKVYVRKDGVFVSQHELGEKSATYSVLNRTSGGSVDPLDEDWTFSVSIIRKSDLAVIQTRNAEAYHATFGQCDPDDVGG